ncbi:hypothetical protein M8C21_008582 [Ambrosia artemisiifolia]|uniref:Uncharacterized protein n=1 Tax=Ambrosia artemisiifolia TaxID=4212 RepID=A0AAD5G3G7_AMBAR|nr:hypothetical protein M8C21_008582 [Ambrosia artemisiifolia]
MKSIFMRVLFCKIHCSSFICFCKPSTASHLYNSGPLKLESSPQAPHLSVVTDASDQNNVEETVEGIKENEGSEDGKEESQIEIIVIKSCMKKKKGDSLSRSATDRKKVQWVDNLGKQLVDIREFESSETGDDNEDNNKACFCAIL